MIKSTTKVSAATAEQTTADAAPSKISSYEVLCLFAALSTADMGILAEQEEGVQKA